MALITSCTPQDPPIVHNDLKSLNILVTYEAASDRFVAKLADLEFAQSRRPEHQTFRTLTPFVLLVLLVLLVSSSSPSSSSSSMSLRAAPPPPPPPLVLSLAGRYLPGGSVVGAAGAGSVRDLEAVHSVRPLGPRNQHTSLCVLHELAC